MDVDVDVDVVISQTAVDHEECEREREGISGRNRNETTDGRVTVADHHQITKQADAANAREATKPRRFCNIVSDFSVRSGCNRTVCIWPSERKGTEVSLCGGRCKGKSEFLVVD